MAATYIYTCRLLTEIGFNPFMYDGFKTCFAPFTGGFFLFVCVCVCAFFGLVVLWAPCLMIHARLGCWVANTHLKSRYLATISSLGLMRALLASVVVWVAG